ncbi:hypothetical protein JG688_00014722 [Phytophthora aleatoria]|uniref:Uncharacterized protein n=1 Tax=Phytophthora aleatoria TaxID=2496075 RepID=A0A8J5IUY5_9STRA|nr:hypothetical protein JG688_00014722 [Phytophthora aleatoria]
MEGSRPRDGSTVADTGLELLADVASMTLRSPTPSSTTDLIFLDAGPLQPDLSADSPLPDALVDVSMDALLEALHDADAEPLSDQLDVAWGALDPAVHDSSAASGVVAAPAPSVASPTAPSPPVASPTAVSPPSLQCRRLVTTWRIMMRQNPKTIRMTLMLC